MIRNAPTGRREARLPLRNAAAATAMALIVGASGCLHNSSAEKLSADRLSRLGLSYALYAAQHNGVPPASAEDLQRYLDGRFTAEELNELGAKDVAELFVSPCDGKPYREVRLRRLPAPDAERLTVVFYEQSALGGKYRAALLGGGCVSVDDEELQQSLSSRGAETREFTSGRKN